MVLTLKNIFIANRKFLLKALSLITLSLMVINCGGSSGGSGGSIVVSGTVTYDPSRRECANNSRYVAEHATRVTD